MDRLCSCGRGREWLHRKRAQHSLPRFGSKAGIETRERLVEKDDARSRGERSR